MIDRCWFGHDWEKWETYPFQYNYALNFGALAGKQFSKVELRQKRTCKRCGKTQDELVRD